MKDKGGNAIDAAISTTLCIGMLNAFSSGIGGGGFMVVRVPGQKAKHKAQVTSIDFRETAPAAANETMYKDTGRNGSQIGGLAVGVPGELRGLEAAHKLGGSLPWNELVEPVAQIGLNGWQVSAELAGRLNKSAWITDSPRFRDIYFVNGKMAVEGDTIKREKYGNALMKIAKEGPGAFYEGSIADDIINAVHEAGGILTHEDLKNYTVRQKKAISSTFRGKTVHTMDAPSSGLVMLGMLNIYEPLFPGREKCWKEEDIHNRLEAMKFAFGARSGVSDPAFNANASEFPKFYSKEWAKEQRDKITYQVHDASYYGLNKYDAPDHGTTHIATLDEDGYSASITTTVNLLFGAHLATPEWGIFLNDEMDDFAVPGESDAFGLPPMAVNFPQPGKRPLSSTAPSIVEAPGGKSVYAVVGGSGGSRIFPSVAQVILNAECGDDISAAIERVRWHNQLSPNITSVEVGTGKDAADPEVIYGLLRRGEIIGEYDINAPQGQVQGILVNKKGELYAASDSRKHGVAAVY